MNWNSNTLDHININTVIDWRSHTCLPDTQTVKLISLSQQLVSTSVCITMGSMDEVDTAYLNQRIAQLESRLQLQADLYMIERTTGKRWSAVCGIFQLLWLLACTVLISIILMENITDTLPVGTIMSWIPDDNPPPEGDHHSLDRKLINSVKLRLACLQRIFNRERKVEKWENSRFDLGFPPRSWGWHWKH